MQVTVYNFFESSTADSIVHLILDAIQSKHPEDLIEIIDMSEKEIKPCIGCFNCWVKTPGVCVHKDEMSFNYKKIIHSDRLVVLMPIQMGFIVSKVKAFIDRMIPLYHPYIGIFNGEMMHEYRYEKYPDIDFYFSENQLEEKDIQIIEDYLFRVSYHFRVQANRLIYNQQLVKKPLEHRLPQSDRPWMQYSEEKGKVIIYNGSPRGLKGNSLIIIKQMIEGMKKMGLSEAQLEVRSLHEVRNHDLWGRDFANHSRHIFVLPLYVHGMPSIVKAFMERIIPSGTNSATHVSFLIQSGFIERFQSAYIVPYFAQFTKKINAVYGGTVIKGGIEGIQTRPVSSRERLYEIFRKIGEQYVAERQFDEAYAKKIGAPLKLSGATIFLFRLIHMTGLTNAFWNNQLKENGVYDRRDDQPF